MYRFKCHANDNAPDFSPNTIQDYQSLCRTNADFMQQACNEIRNAVEAMDGQTLQRLLHAADCLEDIASKVRCVLIFDKIAKTPLQRS